MQIAGCSGCRLALKIEPTAGLAMYDPGEPRCQFVLQVEGDRPTGALQTTICLLAPPGGGHSASNFSHSRRTRESPNAHSSNWSLSRCNTEPCSLLVT